VGIVENAGRLVCSLFIGLLYLDLKIKFKKGDLLTSKNIYKSARPLDVQRTT
jgi:hypothetical protein